MQQVSDTFVISILMYLPDRFHCFNVRLFLDQINCRIRVPKEILVKNNLEMILCCSYTNNIPIVNLVTSFFMAWWAVADYYDYEYELFGAN